MRHDVAALAINNNKKQRRRGGFETHKDGSGCEGGNYKMPVLLITYIIIIGWHAITFEISF